MVQPDPALGIAVNFPSATVRNALLFAMQMGKPNQEIKQVKFVKKSAGKQYFLDETEVFPPPLGNLRVDRDGRPLNPDVRLIQGADEEIAVDVAIETTEATAEETPVGNFRPVKATVTLMEEEYQQIKGSQLLRYNEDEYGFTYELDATGLFDMTFHTLIFFALDES